MGERSSFYCSVRDEEGNVLKRRHQDRQQAMRAFREQINSSKKADYPDESADERIWRKLMKHQERYTVRKASRNRAQG
jgi:hypothetical protein